MKVLWSPVYYKIKGNYFKGKIWVLYIKQRAMVKVKKLQFGSFVTTLTSGISTNTTTNVKLTLSVAVSLCRLPLRFHINKKLSMRHH